MLKPSRLQAFAHRPALVRSKSGFENRIKNTFFIRSVSAYRELLIAAVLVVTIVQHRTSVLDKTACVCSKTSRVEHTKSVHNRPKPAVFVRTALGLSSNQNEVAINSKSGLWRTALLQLSLNGPWTEAVTLSQSTLMLSGRSQTVFYSTLFALIAIFLRLKYSIV